MKKQKEKNNIFTFKIGGRAGFGIMSSGLLFSKIASRSGYHVFDYSEYPSLVRGGHNVFQATVGDEPVRSPRLSTNILVALDQNTIDLHKEEIVKGGFLIFDSKRKMNAKKVSGKAKLLDIPFYEIAEETGGTIMMRNTVVLGSVCALLDADLEILEELIKESFAHKKKGLVEKNLAACQAGYNYVLQHFEEHVDKVLSPKEKIEKQALLTANESAALGALSGGLQFASIYPMTPTSNILHILAPLQKEFNFVYKQPEDEISAINMAIGASYSGARSMVATSGGGFCLMSEGFGLAGITETPLVVVEGMRGAPATGLPTWTEQGDLRFVLHAHQGDFPRIVLAPGDAEETFYLVREAFNLADRYQTPVVVLLDKHLCESHLSTPLLDSKFKIDRGKLTLKKTSDSLRYAFSKDGISTRIVPGTGNHVLANSDEHNEKGYSEESSENRNMQMKKRMKKLETCEKNDMPKPKLFGNPKAKTTIVSWGSNKGAILDAMDEKENFNYLHLNWLSPFPAKQIKKILSSSRKIICVEGNYSGQLSGLIQEKVGITIKKNFRKYDGRPIYTEEIIKLVR